MSDYLPPNYDFAQEISDSFDQGYVDAATLHRAASIGVLDANGLEVGYSIGYKAARDFHKAAVVSGTDSTGQSRAYLDGYDAASIYHTTNTVSGNDSLGRERGYFEGYKAARDYHTTNSTSGNDSTGTLRGYAEGYIAARNFHTTVATAGNPTNDSTGVDRGYNTGYNAGVAAGFSPRWGMTMSGNQDLTNGTYTRANFNTIQHSEGVTISTGSDRVTPPAGYYDVMAGGMTGHSVSNSEGTIECRIRRSGGNVTQGNYYRGVARIRSTTNSDYGIVHMLRNVYMNGSQYFDVYWRCYHAASISFMGGGTSGSAGVHGGRAPAFFIGHQR